MRSTVAHVAVFALLGAVLACAEALATALTSARFDLGVSLAGGVFWVGTFALAGLPAALLRAAAPPRLSRAVGLAAGAAALALGLTLLLHALALGVLPLVNPRRLGNPRLLLVRSAELTAFAGGAGLVLAGLVMAVSHRARRRGLAVHSLAFAAGVLALLLVGVALRRVVGLEQRPEQVLFAAGSAGAALLAATAVLRLGAARAGWGLLALILLSGTVRALLPPNELSALRRDPFPPPPAHAPPNVVLVVLDTVRADHLELYGYERATMPNLARFAAGARVHTDAVADSSWTLPSHASLFTGLPPRIHGAHGGPAGSEQPGGLGARPLAPEARTLAEVLRARGYATVGVGANWSFLRPRYHLDQGFDVWDARAAYRGAVLEGHVPTVLRVIPALDASPLRALGEPLVRLDVGQVMYRRADEITDEAIRWLRAPRLREGPFLLFVNYLDAHEPYRPPPAFQDRFPGRVVGAPRGRLGFPDALGEETLRAHLAAQYDAELAFLDAELGRLFDVLRAEGRLEDSLVLVTSDHGEAFGEHGRFGHGTSLYQTELFIPLVIHDPRGDAALAGHPDAPTQLHAVTPWLLGRLGVRAPSLPGPIAWPEELQPVEAELLGRKELGRPAHHDLRALRRGPLKLIVDGGEPELYDLAADPHERRDLAAERAAETAGLAAALGALGSAAPQARSVPELSPGELERLRALGYAQ